MPRKLYPLVALLPLFLLTLIPAPVRADDSVLDNLQPDDSVKIRKTADGLRIIGHTNDEAKLFTSQEFQTPLTITAVVKTDANSVRLFFAKGLIILNWEDNVKDLRFHNPKDGGINHAPGKGSIPNGQFVTITWTIDEKRVSIAVDGQPRANFGGSFADISGPVGIGTYLNGNITVKSLEVSSATPSSDPEQISSPSSSKPQPLAINISVRSGKHTPSATTAPSPQPADPSVIERPEFIDIPKPLVKSVTSVTAMMVTIDDDGTEHGLTSDIIATVQPESRHSNKSGVGFSTPDGDYTMKTAFSEAVRAITLRYPIWEPGHIDISFGEKFVAHGGPSAGTAFGVLMLSTLEGFSIDPKCAVTGDITVDWKVRKIGGVVAKLHGATLDNCLYAAIPEDNASALPDMALLYGPSSLANIQVFSIATLQDAVAVTRKDRDSNLAQAIKLFADLQPTLTSLNKAALKSPTTIAALKHILELAPNHASAKYLLEIADGSAPKYLSNSATTHQLHILLHPYLDLLVAPLHNNSIAILRNGVTAISRKRIAELRPLVSREFAPVLTQVAAFVETAESNANHRSPIENLKSCIDLLFASINGVSDEKDFAENLRREGF